MHRSLADHTSAPIHEVQITPSTRQLTKDFNVPFWIDQWLGREVVTSDNSRGNVRITRSAGSDRALLIVTIDDARTRSDRDFADAARAGYQRLAEESATLELPHAVRIWNALPGIHDATADGDRYMSFNIGRHDAMREWLGESLATRVPAATGVGHDRDALIIAALFARTPGTPIDNPRQVPAYQYSSRFGRLPPCFARATLWGSTLFISGTAAVVGEESQYPQAFERQLSVTIEHLRHLLELATKSSPRGCFTSFRAYLPDQETFAARCFEIESALGAASTAPIEFMRADLCRKELLVEIEAVAELTAEHA